MRLFNKKQPNVPRRRLAEEGIVQQTILSDEFKRGQTLAGAVSPQSPRSQVHHLTIRRRKVVSVLLVILLIAAALWMLISNFTARATINVSNMPLSNPVDKSIYEKTIQEYMESNPIGRFSFLLDQSDLNAYIISKTPEVVKVRQQGMLGIGETGFGVEMRVPVAGWVIDGKQHYVDSSGVSFERNYFAPPEVQIIDDSGASLQSGATVVSKRFLGFVGRVVAGAKSSGFTVVQAILPAGTTRELQIRLQEGNQLVKLSIDRPVGEQIEDMTSAVKHFNGKGSTPAYIDVRVSGKAFYK